MRVRRASQSMQSHGCTTTIGTKKHFTQFLLYFIEIYPDTKGYTKEKFRGSLDFIENNYRETFLHFLLHLYWKCKAFAIYSETCVLRTPWDRNVSRLSRYPDFPGHFIIMVTCILGPQLSVWIMKVSLFSSVHINRFRCIENLQKMLRFCTMCCCLQYIPLIFRTSSTTACMLQFKAVVLAVTVLAMPLIYSINL